MLIKHAVIHGLVYFFFNFRYFFSFKMSGIVEIGKDVIQKSGKTIDKLLNG